MILDEILEGKERRAPWLTKRQGFSLVDMKKRALDTEEPRSTLENALMADGINIIAEVKKASPSKGRNTRGLRSARHRRRVRGERCGGDIGPYREEVLHGRARLPYYD